MASVALNSGSTRTEPVKFCAGPCDEGCVPARASPDGRWISYWTGFPASVVAGGIPGAVGSIFIVPSNGGTPREIKTHLASARYPIWSPESEHLLFLGEEDTNRKTHDWYFSSRDGAFCPWLQRVDATTNRPAGPPRAVLHLHDPRLRASSGSAAFDDVQAGYLYMTLTEATGNIWMIDSNEK